MVIASRVVPTKKAVIWLLGIATIAMKVEPKASNADVFTFESCRTNRQMHVGYTTYMYVNYTYTKNDVDGLLLRCFVYKK